MFSHSNPLRNFEACKLNNGQRAKKIILLSTYFLVLLSTWLQNTVATMNHLKYRRSETYGYTLIDCYFELKVMANGHC